MLVAIRPSLNARKQNLLLMEMKALRMELPPPNKAYQSATKHLNSPFPLIPIKRFP